MTAARVWPPDAGTSYAVVNATLRGTGVDAGSLHWGRRWPGQGLPAGGVVQVNAPGAALPGTAWPGGGLPRGAGAGAAAEAGALRWGGVAMTAAALLAAIDSARERAEVEATIRRYALDRTQAADVLAARANVWTRWIGPMVFFNLPWRGPDNEAAAELVMRYERSRPGTLGAAVGGDAAAQAAIRSLIDDTVGPFAGQIVLTRESNVHDNLSTSSTRARTLVASSTRLDQWVAHHLIPFQVMADLPEPVQLRIAQSGWLMDSEENLIAVPANLATFLGPTNGNSALPYQTGPHPKYSADVAAALAFFAINIAGMDGSAIRAGLLAVEQKQRSLIVTRYYHDRISMESLGWQKYG